MFYIDIKKEVQDLVNQLNEQMGITLDENVIALMEWSMKTGLLKAGFALANFNDESISEEKKE